MPRAEEEQSLGPAAVSAMKPIAETAHGSRRSIWSAVGIGDKDVVEEASVADRCG